MKMRKDNSRGFSLLEVVVGISIVAVFLYASLLASRQFLRLAQSTILEVQAGFLLEEGMEAFRSVRDQGWTEEMAVLSPAETYSFSYDEENDLWEIVDADEEVIDELFKRSITVSEVYRDVNDDIAELGVLDPNTILVTVNVDWRGVNGVDLSKDLSAYLTNFFDD